MAKKQTTKSEGKQENGKAEWRGFANVTLSPEAKAAIKANPYDEHELWEGIILVLTTGHKIALSFSPENGNTTVTITGVTKSCLNAGLSMTSTAKDPFTGLNVALYKHFDLCNGTWSDKTDDEDDMS